MEEEIKKPRFEVRAKQLNYGESWTEFDVIDTKLDNKVFPMWSDALSRREATLFAYLLNYMEENK